jgi:phage-related protein
MAAIGPEVADAYIEVHADTEKFRRELRGQLAKDMRRLQKDYKDTFDQDVIDDQTAQLRRFRSQLARAANTGDWSTFKKQFGDSASWAQLLRNEINDISKIKNADGQVFMSAEKRREILDNLNRYVTLAERKDRIKRTLEEEAAWQKLGDTQSRAIKDNIEHTRKWTLILDEARRTNAAFNQAQTIGWTSLTGEQQKSLRFMGDNWAQTTRRMWDDWEGGFAAKMRGSRNDFIHVLGGIFDPFERSIKNGMIPIMDSFDRAMRPVIERLMNMGRFGQLAASGLGNITGLAKVAVPAIAGLAAGFTAIILAAQMFVSLASGLVAMGTALAGSFAFALAALIPLGGALVGFGYGIQLAARATQRFGPAAKTALAELNAAFMEVDVPAFAREWEDSVTRFANTLAEALRTDKIATNLGKAFSAITDSFTGVVNSTSFRKFTTAMETTIPSAMAGLGRGLAGFTEGLLGMFAAAGPVLEKMGNAFGDMGERFASWVEKASADGSLGDFFERAWTSAQKVWDVIKGLASVFGELFDIGKGTGDDWLTGWADGLERFADSLGEGEPGRANLQEWFGRARNLAERLGPFIDDLVGMLEDFDTEHAAENIKDFVDVLGDLLEFIGNVSTAIEAMSNFFETIESPANLQKWWEEIGGDAFVEDIEAGIADAARALADGGIQLVLGLIDGVSSAWNGLLDWFAAAIVSFVEWVKGLLGIASPSTIFAEMGRNIIEGLLQGITNAWNTITEFFSTAISALVAWFGTAWEGIKATVETAWNGVLSVLTTVWTTIQTTATTIWNGLVTFFSTVWAGVQATATTVWNAVSTFLVGVWTTIQSTATTIWNGLVAFFGTVWAGVQATATTVWNGIKTSLSAVWSGIQTVATTVFNAVKTFLQTSWTNMQTTATTVWNAIKGFLGTVWSGIQSTATTVFNAIKAFFQTSWQNMQTTATTVWNAVKGFLTTTWNTIKATATTVWNGITTALTTAANNVRNALTNAWNTAKSTLTTIWNTLKALASSVWNGITSAVTTAVNNARNAATSAWNTLKSTTSSVFNSLKTIVSGAVNNVVSTIQGIRSKVVGAMSAAGSWLWNAGSQVVNGFINGIRSAFGRVQSTLSSLTSMLPSWKGPEERDKNILKNAGQLVIGGFIDGLESQYGIVRRSLGAFTNSLSGVVGNPLGALDNINPGLGALGAGFTGNAGKSITIAPGAIQVNSQARDPRVVAGILLDDLASMSLMG